MLAIIFFIVFVNITCTFLYLLFEREPKKKPVVEEESEKPRHLEYSRIKDAEILHIGFCKKDGGYETFNVFNCRYWIEKDYIILILPDLFEHKISSVLDEDHFNYYISTNRKQLDSSSYCRFIDNCNSLDVSSIRISESFEDPYSMMGYKYSNLLSNYHHKLSHIKCITELEYLIYYEKYYN